MRDYTPPPWRAGTEFEPGKYPLREVIAVAGAGEVIAHVNVAFGRGPANAALIVHAPALLEAARINADLCRDLAGDLLTAGFRDAAKAARVWELSLRALIKAAEGGGT